MGFMHIGPRGGANVSYCLGITDILPSNWTCTLNGFKPESKSPPDFDIDWRLEERDIILEYIFNRYGRDHVALWYECRIQIPLDIPERKWVLVCKEELDTGKKPMQLHDTNSVVALVAKNTLLENIQSTQHAFLRN
jgi:DNA polymerase-3 subunit alpha/error-prone DNA polymerase